jgi:hypothetical protein
VPDRGRDLTFQMLLTNAARSRVVELARLSEEQGLDPRTSRTNPPSRDDTRGGVRVAGGEHDRGHAPAAAARRSPGWPPVLDRLEAAHDVIHEMLEDVDRALVSFGREAGDGEELRSVVDELDDTLRSHLS